MKDNLTEYIDTFDKLCGGTGEEGDERHQAIRKIDKGNGEVEWEYTNYGKKMKNICACYLPGEYYDWYKDNELQGDKTNLSLEVKPQCFHTDCQRTLLYDTGPGSGCPDLQMCFQSLEQNITVKDGSKLSLGSERSFPSQACNFSNVGNNPQPESPGSSPQSVPGSPDAAGSPPTTEGGQTAQSCRRNYEKRRSWNIISTK